MRSVALALAVVLMAAPGCVSGPRSAGGGVTGLAELVGTASSPAQHRLLADRYRALAAEEESKAAQHRRLARTYEETATYFRPRYVEHCETLAAGHDRLAADYEGLAVEHDREAARLEAE